MKIMTYIINFNRLTWTKALVEYLFQVPDLEIIIIDNSSTYPPLLDWYNKQNKCEVFRQDKNYGSNVFWIKEMMNQAGDYFIVTDPDLDLSRIPLDFVDVLKEGLERYPFKQKCGFGLEINDIPKKKNHNQIRAIKTELGYWIGPFDGLYYYDSMIDTTFALYMKSRCLLDSNELAAIRTGYPYVARHLPWYYTVDNLTEEDIYYINSVDLRKGCSSFQRLKIMMKEGRR